MADVFRKKINLHPRGRTHRIPLFGPAMHRPVIRIHRQRLQHGFINILRKHPVELEMVKWLFHHASSFYRLHNKSRQIFWGDGSVQHVEYSSPLLWRKQNNPNPPTSTLGNATACREIPERRSPTRHRPWSTSDRFA